jgi:predicted cobalt transporter CbtA
VTVLALSVVGTVVLVLVALLLVLFLTGLAMNARRRRAAEGRFGDRIAEANRALADAHAQDKGWAPETVEAAAREAFAAAHPGAPLDGLSLVQVIDLPGTEADQAVFHVVSRGEEHTITLGRTGGRWQAV